MPTVFAPSKELLPRLQEGRQVADAGELGRAAAHFQDLLTAGAGEGPFDRLFLLSSLMTVFSRLGRQFETLVLARFLTDRLIALGQLEAAAGCMATYCEAISGVGAREMRERRLEDLERIIAALDPGEGGMPREAYHGCAFDLALEAGDLVAARHHVERYRSYLPKYEGRRWRKASQTAIFDIRLDLASGMPHRALETLERLERSASGYREPAAILAWMRVRCLEAAGELPRAEAAARRYLALLEETRDDASMAPHRMRNASRLAAWLAERPGHESAARRTYDLAAGAVLQRISQLNTSVHELERIGVDVAGATEDLAELRRGFVAEQGDLLARVAELFRRDPGAYAHLMVAEDDDEELIHLCAWCERVRTQEGLWLPIGHFIPRVGPLPISHGICSDCLQREHIR
ncbi:MAG: hypothetical protein QNJ98_07950 [Planctomycetota bacterium]|nr:hypothetical protein [Planctomycetota bacterium]